MSVITISRGSYSWGKKIAEKVAERLNYDCVARDVLIEASEEYNIPEIKLTRAIQSGPSFLDRFTYKKAKYIAYIQAAILRHLRKDNVVYHGLAGHFFVRNISHVLKVRIIADFEDRVKLVMERDGISSKEAVRFLRRIDDERRRWSQQLYGIDTWDPSLYDLVVHIQKISVDDAVDIITHTVKAPHFQPTPESQKAMADLALSAEVKAALIHMKPDIEVSAQEGEVYVKTDAEESKEADLIRQMEDVAKNIPGVKRIRIQVFPSVPYGD